MNNRKISRSDLAFQKLKKYQEKYKTNQTSVRRNSGSADSESDIEQYKSLITKYTGPRESHQDSPRNLETSKHVLQKAEDFAIEESLVNGNIRSPNKRSHVAQNNKSLIIDLKIDNVHLVNSDDSKAELSTGTNLFPNTCLDRNRMSCKKSFNAAKITAQQSKIMETMPSMKAIANNNSIESDTFNDINNIHRHITPHDSHIHPEDHQICSNTVSEDNKLTFHTNNKDENKTVDLQLTDEIKEMQQPSQSVEYYKEQDTNESSKQINYDFLNNREKLSAEPGSISTEIFQSTSNSDVTSYEVPDISNSNDIDVREKSECSHFGTVVASESSVTSTDDVPQKTDDKTITVPSSDNTINNHLNNAVPLCSKCKKSLKKQCKSQTNEIHCYCNNKSTQTNTSSVDFLHHMTHIQHSNTTTVEDTVLSPYNLFVYHHLLHGYSKDTITKDPGPAVRFLNKSLMEQVNITQYVINSQHAIHKAYCTAARNLSKSYQPVTLENTMQFIKQSKKKKKNKLVSP